MYEEPLHIPTDLAFVGEDRFCIGYQILGSCDGLFCTSSDFEDLFLWNPSTTELKNFPPLGINLHLKEEGNDFSYGFGYIECQSDYRVVEIVENKCNNCYKNDVSVYSLRTNSWKMIQECPNVNLLDQAGKFVNGKLHWVVADPDRYRVSGWNSTWFITSLDLVDETFGDVVLPDLDYNYLDCEIGSSGGSLCFFSYSKIKTDVWVMKEYESWTKVASIPSKNYDAWPIFISQNDEILVHDGSSLVWYNTRDNTFVRPVNQIHCISANNFSVYVESLVSLNFLEED
ncbi:F-box/kelch-repeat protein At3g23880-like [Lycium ferocissimum]|uniref:F-box/kelch-repeat protein At3g23880-like n=1 Tax=Lycium ferocissimum TaxID=112874 RepID=UPI0028169D34|nr:F-box/kelch-repeat protein At3g23880-like [Lycium ferocissimum]